MRKITKFLMAGLMLLTCAVGLSNTRGEVKEAEAAVEAKVNQCVLKLDSNIWGQANAYYSIHYWGGNTSTEWPGEKFNNGNSAKGSVEITAKYDSTSTHCIIIRWGNSDCTTEWNRWDYFDANSMTTKYNYFTNDGWGSCSSSYIEPNKYTINFYDGANNIGSETVENGTKFNSKFQEKEGYRFEGWYTDDTFTSEFKKGTEINSDLTLYAKYVEATDYTISFEYAASTGWDKVYAYAWRDSSDGTYNEEWPGVEMTSSNGIFTYEVDASQSYSKIIFNNNNGKQTINLDLETSDGIYTLGDKNSESKYTATFTSTNFIVGKIDVEDESLGIAYKFFSALPVEANKNDEEAYNVGFKFEFIRPGSEEVSATGYYTCSNLETLTYDADGDEGDEVAEEHTATADGYKTYFAVTVYKIPEDYVGGKVIVTPAYQNTNGHTVMCVAKTFDII